MQGLFAGAAGAFASAAGQAPLLACDASVAGMNFAFTNSTPTSKHHYSTDSETALSGVLHSRTEPEKSEHTHKEHLSAVELAAPKDATHGAEESLAAKSSFEAAPSAAMCLAEMIALFGLKSPPSITSRVSALQASHDTSSSSDSTHAVDVAEARAEKSASEAMEHGASVLALPETPLDHEDTTSTLPLSIDHAVLHSISVNQHAAHAEIHKESNLPVAHSAARASGRPSKNDDTSISEERPEHVASARIFTGSSTIILSDQRVEGSSRSTFDMLTAHLTPPSITASHSDRPAFIQHTAKHRRMSISRGADGIVHIAMKSVRDESDWTLHFERRPNGMHFAGISRNDVAVSPDAQPAIATPVPTFTPGAGISEGMFDAPAVSGSASFGFTDEEEIRLDLENMLADLALEQIRQGPENKVLNKLMKRANAFLLKHEHTDKPREITPARWKRMIRRAISMTARSVPIYDEKGVRTKRMIQKDAIALVGMEMNTFLAWERRLGIDILEDELSFSDRTVDDAFEDRMIAGLKKRLPALAKLRLTSSFIDPALGIAGEANLQWGIASISTGEDEEKKITTMLGYLKSVFASNKHAACKGIALVLKHANIAGNRKSNDRIFPRWSEPQVTSLIKEVMLSELWEIMGHRALRAHFTDDPEMNAFINEAIFSANYAKAMRDLDKIDVTQVSEQEFWDAVEETGVEEMILADMYARMGQH